MVNSKKITVIGLMGIGDYGLDVLVAQQATNLDFFYNIFQIIQVKTVK